MEPGSVVAGRFELEACVARGGMGEIFRARDRQSGALVAIKLLRGDQHSLDRFEREARVLSQLDHPAIVRYLEHGYTEPGAPYVAMDWLDGCDLATYLGRTRLSIEEALAIVRQVAEALSVAHARGVIHRDVKPRNIFLVGSDPSRIRVLDFGVAHFSGESALTKTGEVVGTVAYMAPEQARGAREVTARADVFALGCLMFECLTGARAFPGDNAGAVLAKVLFQAPPSPSELRADIPEPLETFLKRMLAQDPLQRPPDGAAVAAEIHALVEQLPQARLASKPSPMLTANERRLISVVLVQGLNRAETVDRDSPHRDPRDLAHIHGGQIQELAHGLTTITFSGMPVATDLAGAAARCALEMRETLPQVAIAIATCQSQGSPALDDALNTALAALPIAGASIAVDGLTERLLRGRFEIIETGGASRLTSVILQPTQPLSSSGNAPPLVEREWELQSLNTLFQQCVTESRARAVLITGVAGLGKSRLAGELLKQIEVSHPQSAIWIGAADWLSAGSAFKLLAEVIRSALGIPKSASAENRRAALLSGIAALVPEKLQGRIGRTLGDLLGTPLEDEPGSGVDRFVRENPEIKREEIERTWHELVAAQIARRPLIMVLEDLHWGDAPTVRMMDTALREYAERPLMVIALARPDLHEKFPNLWDEHGVQEIRLKELSRRGSELLARTLLAKELSDSAVERIVTRAAGHPFYLEELVANAARQSHGDLPESLAAMVQSRLGALEPEARRVLRAASVFGHTFPVEGVTKLIGTALTGEWIQSWLSKLAERRILVRRRTSESPSSNELSFRHELLREGAYALLTDDDRRTGHLLAGEWLEDEKHPDPLTMAEHFERGGAGERAASHFLQASEAALCGADLDSAMNSARRGLRCGATGEIRTRLSSALSNAHAWRGEFATALSYSDEILQAATPGDKPWTLAIYIKVVHAVTSSDSDLTALLETILSVQPAPDAAADMAILLQCCVSVVIRDDVSESLRVQRRLEEVASPYIGQHPVFEACVCYGRACVAACQEQFWLAGKEFRRAQELFSNVMRNQAALCDVACAMMLGYLGDAAEGERAFRASPGSRMAGAAEVGGAFLSLLMANRGRLDEAAALASEAIAQGRATGSPLQEGLGHYALAMTSLRSGRTMVAEAEALAAVDLLRVRAFRTPALAVHAAALLAQGSSSAALARAEEAMKVGLGGPVSISHSSFVVTVLAEAQKACGDEKTARATLVAGRDQLLQRASVIDDPVAREHYLRGVPENAHLLELATRWL